MDKDHYIEQARAIEGRAEQEMERVMRAGFPRPWRWSATLSDLAGVMRDTLTELRSLEPPPEDRDDIELHYLTPAAAELDRLEKSTKNFRRALHRAQFRKAFRILASFDQPESTADVAWRNAYGLGPRRRQIVGFSDRAAAAGIMFTEQSVLAALVPEDVEQLRRGGPLAPLLSLSVLLGLVAGAITIRRTSNAIVPIAVGLATFAVLTTLLVVNARRRGQLVAEAVERNPDPHKCVAIAYPIPKGRGRAWELSVVPDIGPAMPVAATLGARPPASVRKRGCEGTVYGDPSPGGRFAVRFADGYLVGVAEPARALPVWPPRRFRHK